MPDRKLPFKDKPNYKVYVFGQATYTITQARCYADQRHAKEYDGTPLTNDTVTAEGFVNDEGVTITVTGTQTEVGSSDNTFTYEPKDNNTNLSNYKITTQYGTLTVTAKPRLTRLSPIRPPIPRRPRDHAHADPDARCDACAHGSAEHRRHDAGEHRHPAPTATAAPTATPALAPTAAPAAARLQRPSRRPATISAVVLVIVMLAAIVGLGITVVLRTDKKKLNLHRRAAPARLGPGDFCSFFAKKEPKKS